MQLLITVLLLMVCALISTAQESTLNVISSSELDQFSKDLQGFVGIESESQIATDSQPVLNSVGGQITLPVVFSFDIVFKIESVQAVSLDSASWLAIRETLANFLVIPINRVGEGSIVDEYVDSASAQTSDVIVSVSVTLYTADYPQSQNDAEQIFTNLANGLTADVVSQSFTQSLQDAAMSLNAIILFQSTVNTINFYNYVVSDATAKPIFDLKPTGNINGQPTSFPTGFPTGFPTSFPSSFPTSFPTSMPTDDSGTGGTGHNAVFDFDIYIELKNVSSSTLSEPDQTMLINLIADVWDVSPSTLTFLEIVHELEQPNDQWEMIVSLEVNLHTSDFPQWNNNITKITLYLQTLLLQSNIPEQVGALSMLNDNLASQALQIVNDLNQAVIVEIRFSDFDFTEDGGDQPTLAPVSGPASADDDGNGSGNNNEIVLHVYLGLDQTATTTLTTAGEEAVLAAIADVLDVSVGQAQFIAITDSQRRRLAQAKTASNHAMVVAIQVMLPLSDFSAGQFQGNQTKMLLSLESSLMDAFASGTLQTLIQQGAGILSAVELAQVVVFKVSFQPFTLSGNNNNGNGNNDDGKNQNNGSTDDQSNPTDDANNNNNGSTDDQNNSSPSGNDDGNNNNNGNNGNNGGSNTDDANNGNNGGNNGNNGGSSTDDANNNNNNNNSGNDDANNNNNNNNNDDNNNNNKNPSTPPPTSPPATTDTNGHHKHHHNSWWTAAHLGYIIGGGIVFLGLLACMIYFAYKRYKESKEAAEEENEKAEKATVNGDDLSSVAASKIIAVEDGKGNSFRLASTSADQPKPSDTFILDIMDEYGYGLAGEHVQSVESGDGASVFNSLVLTDSEVNESKF